MSTLAEITGVESDVLRKKFQLEPQFCYDPNRSENLAFMSPLVLLKDSDLKPEGYHDRGPKTTMGRIAKDILEPDGHMLFQVPEVTYLHLGYAKKSASKKGKMAINEVAAKEWKSYLNMSRFTRHTSHSEPTSDEEEAMDLIDFPNAADTQAVEAESTELGLVQPCKSGLKIPLKGRYILLFSILLIFQDKKRKEKKGEEDSTKNEDKIGEINHRKVQEIIQHHQRRDDKFHNFVEKSASDIIEESFASSELSDELQDVILEKYRDCYGGKMDVNYKMLENKDGTPIILVPKDCQVKKMPAKLDDIGKRWRELGEVKLFDQFMQRFIKNPDIQKDFFESLRDLKDRQGINYAIILPDESTFSELVGGLKKESAHFVTKVGQGKYGRERIVPEMALVTAEKTHLTLCFSYYQGELFLLMVHIDE